MLQYVTICYNVLQNMLQNMLQYLTISYNMLQFVDKHVDKLYLR